MLDLLESRQKLAEVQFGSTLRRLWRQREKSIGVLEVLLEKLIHRGSQVGFAGHCDVGLLDFKFLEKPRTIGVELLAAMAVAAADGKEQPGIHPLDRFLHAFRRQDAGVILAQDHIDVPPQAVEHDDRPQAQHHKDRQGRQKAEEQPRLNRLHRGIPAKLLATPMPKQGMSSRMCSQYTNSRPR